MLCLSGRVQVIVASRDVKIQCSAAGGISICDVIQTVRQKFALWGAVRFVQVGYFRVFFIFFLVFSFWSMLVGFRLVLFCVCCQVKTNMWRKEGIAYASRYLSCIGVFCLFLYCSSVVVVYM